MALTYRHYAALPDNRRRCEIHGRELSLKPAPGTAHQKFSRNLLVALHLHVSGRGLGEVLDAPTDVILSDTTIVQPDIVFVAPEHADRVGERILERVRMAAVAKIGQTGRLVILTAYLAEREAQ